MKIEKMKICAESRAETAKEEEGSVTAEFALLVPSIVFMILVVLSAAFIAHSRIGLEEAARSGAREAARSSSSQAVQTAVVSASSKASYSLNQEGDLVRIRVTQRIIPALPWLAIDLNAEAVTRQERIDDAPWEPASGVPEGKAQG